MKRKRRKRANTEEKSLLELSQWCGDSSSMALRVCLRSLFLKDPVDKSHFI